MRMWNVDVTKMCTQHLTGEHVELHMFVGSIRKGKNIAGFIRNGMVEVHNIRNRHREIVAEMERRGMIHKSPLPLFKVYAAGHIDVKENERVLAERCSNCLFRVSSIIYNIEDD